MLMLYTYKYTPRSDTMNFKCREELSNIEDIFVKCDSLCEEFKAYKLSFAITYKVSDNNENTLVIFDHQRIESFSSLMEDDTEFGWNGVRFYISHDFRRKMIDYGIGLIDRAKIIDIMDVV